MAKQTAIDGHWSVVDTNATQGPRTHSAGPGRPSYDLKATEPTTMPEADARVFLRDKAFIVRNELGRRVPSLPDQEVMSAGRTPPKLEPGQVVANLKELTTDALLARAQQYPGGDRLTKKSKRDAIIGFLWDAKHHTAAPADEDDDDESPPPAADADDVADDLSFDEGVDEMSAEDVEKMLPKKK